MCDTPFLQAAAAESRSHLDREVFPAVLETAALLMQCNEPAVRLHIPDLVAATAAAEPACPAGADVIVLIAARSFVLVLLRDGPCWYNTYTVTIHST